MNVGLFPMAAKPYHTGHDKAVRKASVENDIVYLFVSLSPRGLTEKDLREKPDELPVTGESMKIVWEKFIEPALPHNVEIVYGGVPIKNLYDFLTAEDSKGSEDNYNVYSDADDMTNYPDTSFARLAPRLFAEKKISRVVTDRVFSATKMRRFLKSGDLTNFVQNLPPALVPNGEEIFDLLVGSGSEAQEKFQQDILAKTQEKERLKSQKLSSKKSLGESTLISFIRMTLRS